MLWGTWKPDYPPVRWHFTSKIQQAILFILPSFITHEFSLFSGSSKPQENILPPDRGTSKTYWDTKPNCPYSVNSPQSEQLSPCRLSLISGFSVFLFSWVMVGGTTQKKGLSRHERPNISHHSTATDPSVQELALAAVWWHRERLTCGLAGNLWGFQRTVLGFKWILWPGNNWIKYPGLVSMDSGGCGCIQTELRWSVIVSLGEYLAFVAFWWLRVSFMRQNLCKCFSFYSGHIAQEMKCHKGKKAH